MSVKLLWTGLTLILVAELLGFSHAVGVAGAVIMAIGTVLLWLDK